MTAPRHQTTATSDADGRPHLWRRLAAASGLGFLGAAMSYVVFVWTSPGQRFDDDAFVGLSAVSSRVKNVATDQVGLITFGTFSAVVGVLLLIGFLRRRPRLGVAMGLGAIIAVVGSYVARTSVLPHPNLVKGAEGALAIGTFPSGHTTTAMVCALALMVVVPPRWRGAVAVAVGAYTCAIAMELQIVLWHRPSDVIGGAFLAFAVITGAAALVARCRPVAFSRVRPSRLPLVLLSGTALVAASIAVWGVVRLRGRLPDPAAYPNMWASFHTARLAGLAVSAFVVLLLVTVLLLLMGRADLDGRQDEVVHGSAVSEPADGEGARLLPGPAPGSVTPAELTRPLWMRP
jgi:membrane-associated phospholipid phosphatase